jgi:hypothetical protein
MTVGHLNSNKKKYMNTRQQHEIEVASDMNMPVFLATQHSNYLKDSDVPVSILIGRVIGALVCHSELPSEPIRILSLPTKVDLLV